MATTAVDTPTGTPCDPIDVLNHLADWLEPRPLNIDVANLLEHLADTIYRTATPADRDRINTTAALWLHDHHLVARNDLQLF